MNLKCWQIDTIAVAHFVRLAVVTVCDIAMAQLSGRSSLRDIVENMSSQAHRLYHLGSARLSRSNLARINEDKPMQCMRPCLESCWAAVRGRRRVMIFVSRTRCIRWMPRPLIFVYLSFRGGFRTTKGAIKLHVGLNHEGYLPEFVTITEGKTHDVTIGRTLKFPKGSMVAIDRGYNDYAWYNQLTEKGIFFVTRLKSNAKTRVVCRRTVLAGNGLTSDQTIEFTGIQTAKKCPIKLRRIGYRDPESGKHYVFLTNNFKLAARTIADIYKARWQVELFFRWIKQNLKIKSFIGTSKNAVLSQIWIALCVYLILAFIKFQSKLNKSMQQILRLLQLNLFEKRDLMALLRGDPLCNNHAAINQLALL